MYFPVPVAGFFATHNNLFFNISFLYVCLPPLKNDGRGELRSGVGLISCPVYANMPLSPRKARHFPPSSGEANAKEKSNQVL